MGWSPLSQRRQASVGTPTPTSCTIPAEPRTKTGAAAIVSGPVRAVCSHAKSVSRGASELAAYPDRTSAAPVAAGGSQARRGSRSAAPHPGTLKARAARS
jgi:hypothetical protein